MRETILKEIEEAIDFAKSSPIPNPDEMNKHLYAGKEFKPCLND